MEPTATLEEALALHQAGNLDEAERRYEQVLEAEPGHPYALHFFGVLCHQQARHERAIELISRAIRAHDGEASFHANLGLPLIALRRLDEAEQSLRRSLELNPAQPQVHLNLGNTLMGLDRFAEAEQSYREALRLAPDYGDARWNLSNVLLLTGNYGEGWRAFEARRSAASLDEAKLAKMLPGNVHILSYGKYSKPRWDGQDPQGKRILVHFEYGFGDTLQFVRYLPMLAARGATVILEAQLPLHDLLSRLEGVHRLVAPGVEPEDYDLHCPLLSLPMHFGTTLETVPARIPYLDVTPDRVLRWSKRMGPRKGFRVAAVWSGNPYPLSDGHKSMPLSTFALLAPLENVSFYGLQKRGEHDAATPMHEHLDWTDLGGEIRDFSDTGAILRNVDLMITIDSGPAHLAGAMGVPAWLMLPRLADWRWGLEERSLWYPHMRLYRQAVRNDWDAVMRRIRADLVPAAAAHAPRGMMARLRKAFS